MVDLMKQDIEIKGYQLTLKGTLEVPAQAHGLVIFVHGSGSSRVSPRNRSVAARLREGGMGTLLFDLLTEEEERIDLKTRHLRFDIELLVERLMMATEWVKRQPGIAELKRGYFGASTGAAAALVAAVELPEDIAAIVSRGGRPDLAAGALEQVKVPTMLIVGGLDEVVMQLNRQALAAMKGARRKLEIVPGASHLFEEAGAMEKVSQLAQAWFLKYFEQKPRDIQHQPYEQNTSQMDI